MVAAAEQMQEQQHPDRVRRRHEIKRKPNPRAQRPELAAVRGSNPSRNPSGDSGSRRTVSPSFDDDDDDDDDDDSDFAD